MVKLQETPKKIYVLFVFTSVSIENKKSISFDILERYTEINTYCVTFGFLFIVYLTEIPFVFLVSVFCRNT